jgi:hypothetical protein
MVRTLSRGGPPEFPGQCLELQTGRVVFSHWTEAVLEISPELGLEVSLSDP